MSQGSRGAVGQGCREGVPLGRLLHLLFQPPFPRLSCIQCRGCNRATSSSPGILHPLQPCELHAVTSTPSVLALLSAIVPYDLIQRFSKCSISLSWELILSSHPRPAASETLGAGPSNLCFNRSSG